jgi:predicted metal-dependent hydrolase
VKAGYEMEGDEELSERKDMPGNQEKIDANKNGKVDAHDFALLRAKKGKKSVKEMWEKAAEVQEGYGKSKKKVAEGKKVEIEIMPQVDTPNDMDPPTGRKPVDDAKKKLKKEEVEPLEEKKLSKAETAKKEKFVKGMKKKYGSFKSKYGERAKEVMYATATKMGKKAA